MFTNGENLTAKTPPGDSQVTTPETPQLSQQAVTRKESKYLTNLQLNLYPNTQLDLFCSDRSPFRCTTPSTLLTNYADPSTWLQSPTKKVDGCKILQFIHTMKIRKILGHKTLWCTYTTTSSRERNELGQELRLWSQFAWTEFAHLWTIWRPLKQLFYMSRVRRKKSPKTHSRIPRKLDQNFEILKPQQIGGVEKLSTSCRDLMNLHSLLDFLNRLEDFNTWSWNKVSWSI